MERIKNNLLFGRYLKMDAKNHDGSGYTSYETMIHQNFDEVVRIIRITSQVYRLTLRRGGG